MYMYIYIYMFTYVYHYITRPGAGQEAPRGPVQGTQGARGAAGVECSHISWMAFIPGIQRFCAPCCYPLLLCSFALSEPEASIAVSYYIICSIIRYDTIR